MNREPSSPMTTQASAIPSPMSPAMRIALLLALSVLLATYSAALLVPLYSNTQTSDFANFYYPAAHLFITDGDPYSVQYFLQPPALLLPLAPFATLPLETARALWLVLQLLMLGVGIAATIKVLHFRLTDLRTAFVLMVYLSPNVIWGVMIGQLTVLIFFLQSVGLWLLHSNRPFLGGLALGAIVLKPHLLAVQLPVLLSAPRQAWAGAATSFGVLLLGPELVGIHLLGPFLGKLLPQVSKQVYNMLHPAEMFVHFGGGPLWLRAIGWGLLALLGFFYAWLLWRIWRERAIVDGSDQWHLTPTVQQAMVAAFLWLPYSLAYDMILIAGSYLWLFQARDYRLDRLLTWNLGLLWLLPFITLTLHAAGVPTTLNPLLVIGLILLIRATRQQATPAPAATPTVAHTWP